MRSPISGATVFILSVGVLTLGEGLRVLTVKYEQRDRVSGPAFAAWDFHFGQIESESGEWLAAAAERGSLGFRELSCRVTRDMTTLVFPLEGEHPRYGFTFEYETTKPGLPVDVRVEYTNGRDGVERETGQTGERGILRADRGRFCYSKFDIDGVIKPGRYCYRAVVQGQLLKEWCITETNR
jgi:hypothetical protein